VSPFLLLFLLVLQSPTSVQHLLLNTWNLIFLSFATDMMELIS
jgi:hypothetical protein